MEILAVGDEAAPALGTSDAELLRWIEREGFVLISRNRRTIPSTYGSILRPEAMSPGSFSSAAIILSAKFSRIRSSSGRRATRRNIGTGWSISPCKCLAKAGELNATPL